MEEKKYTKDGYLIVSETEKCPLWEKTTIPCRIFYYDDCFFCKFTDFRTDEFIEKVENEPRIGKLYSVCNNPKNKRTDNQNSTGETEPLIYK